jgi:hypothetical protein
LYGHLEAVTLLDQGNCQLSGSRFGVDCKHSKVIEALNSSSKQNLADVQCHCCPQTCNQWPALPTKNGKA